MLEGETSETCAELGNGVLPVDPSGFSDDDGDLFSDAFREVSGCLLLNVKGTFIGMSESRRGIINGAETATSVPCDPRNNRRTIRPA